MADNASNTNSETGDPQGSGVLVGDPDVPHTRPSDRPDFFAQFATLFKKPPKTGAHCEYCGWYGPTSDVLKAPRLNEDGKSYMINTCPSCMRNGGLIFYD